MHSVSSFLKSPNFIGEGNSFNAIYLSLHFTQLCAFLTYLFRFMGYYLWFYRGKDTKKMGFARGEAEKIHNIAKNIAHIIKK